MNDKAKPKLGDTPPEDIVHHIKMQTNSDPLSLPLQHLSEEDAVEALQQTLNAKPLSENLPEPYYADEKYIYHLIEAGQKSQEDYDKTVIALSGGALGVSLTILKDFIGTTNLIESGYLFLAWGLWTASMIFVLISFFCSRKLTDQYLDHIYKLQMPVAGKLGTSLNLLNLLSGIFFIIGILSLGIFLYNNIK